MQPGEYESGKKDNRFMRLPQAREIQITGANTIGNLAYHEIASRDGSRDTLGTPVRRGIHMP